MSNIKAEFGSSLSITMTLASLAAGSSRESAVVDNSANKFLDALLTVKIKLATGTPGGSNAIYIYGFGSEDGTVFTDNAAGAGDAAITLRSPTDLVPIGVLFCPAAVTGGATFTGVFSVAKAFGGILPRKWGVVIKNDSGLALDSTGANFQLSYTGIYYTIN